MCKTFSMTTVPTQTFCICQYIRRHTKHHSYIRGQLTHCCKARIIKQVAQTPKMKQVCSRHDRSVLPDIMADLCSTTGSSEKNAQNKLMQRELQPYGETICTYCISLHIFLCTHFFRIMGMQIKKR